MILNKIYKEYLFIVFFMIASHSGYSEQIGLIENKDTLHKLVYANKLLFQINIDSAFNEIDHLLHNAVVLKDTVSELSLLERKCRFYYSKNNVEKLLNVAQQFNKQSISYSSLSEQATSHIYLAEVYSFTELFSKSLIELHKALEIMKDREDHLDDILIKINILTSFANVYMQENKPLEAISSLQKANVIIFKITDEQRIKKFQHLNFANMASIYMSVNIDSAKHYALLSSQILPKENQSSKIRAQNFFVTGRFFELQNRNKEAYNEYIKAYEIIRENGEELNVKEIYHSIINVSRKNGDTSSVNKFEGLLQKAEMNSLKSKYNSMHKILEMQDGNRFIKRIIRYKLVFGLVILLMLFVGIVFYFFYMKKRKKALINTDTYNDLLKLINEDDPAFMGVFETLYPDFTKKLLSINQTLTRSEIEFCALLKLNLTTKQISQFRFIEIRTVQNKKYRIRKRLNIPESSDLYNWLEMI